MNYQKNPIIKIISKIFSYLIILIIKIKFVPTEEGRELHGKLMADLLKFIDEVFKEAGEKEITELSSLLEKINDLTEKKIKKIMDPELPNENCKD